MNAAAPDKEKLADFGRRIQSVKLADMESDAGKACALRIGVAVDALLEAIRKEYKSLGK